ncbi:cytoplasmic chaperone [Campylobacter sp. P255]|uniref:TorD/DmsD family molecular chaperone n=1 Tax=Campylobacter sp. P255 TaxID=1979368 RepID=UPI000EAA8248|nr:molecular chaperone TorD family protein [Campylobacter sp. P255]RKO64418.1 cytoplasmic chaperone [Campylobacter sp. P255]
MKQLAIDVFISFIQNPPNQSLLNQIKENKLWQDWFLKNENPLQIEALKLLSSNEDEALIGSDFVSLFISDIEYTKAPPFASFYLDKDKEIYSSNSNKIKDIFLNHRFCDFLENEPSDSLVNELLFIKELINTKNNKVLKNFLEKEFFTWFYLWSKDLLNGSKSNFYKGLSMLMEDFFQELEKNL